MLRYLNLTSFHRGMTQRELTLILLPVWGRPIG